MIAIILLLILVIAVILPNVRIVPQEHTFVIERLGKYRTTWEAGLHVKIPLIDRVSKKISLKEQVMDFPPQPVITKDNVSVDVDSIVFSKVFDSRLYTYGVEDAVFGLENLSATTLRNIIGDMELDKLLSSREEINAKMRSILDDATDKWGLKVTRVEIKNIDPPLDITEAMTRQMKAEREKRQTVLEAEAHKESVERRAEGDKHAAILNAQAEKAARIAIAEGEAESIKLVYQAQAEGLEALKNAKIDSGVLSLKGLDALRDVANGTATKIYIPTDLMNAVGSFGLISESLGIGDAEIINKEPKKAAPLPEDPCLKKTSTEESKSASATAQKIRAEMENTRRGATL